MVSIITNNINHRKSLKFGFLINDIIFMIILNPIISIINKMIGTDTNRNMTTDMEIIFLISSDTLML